MRACFVLLLLTWWGWAGGCCAADSPAVTEEVPAPAVVPVHYLLHLEPSWRTGHLEGAEEIILQVHTPVPAVVLDAVRLDVSEAVLRDDAGRSVDLTVEADESAGTVRLSAGDPIGPGEYQLDLRFAGTFGREAHGLFLQGLPDTAGEVLTANLAPRAAREVFPCFDDPRYRAGVRLSLRVPKRLRVVSNGSRVAEQPIGVDEKMVMFADCPAMPLHFLGFVAGEFGAVEDSFGDVRLRFLTTPGKEEAARHALSLTKTLLRHYEETFGVPFPLEKLDQVALPAPADGGVTGWGFVAYPEGDVLTPGDNPPSLDEAGLFQRIAHALAQQWLGSLVGFATWDEFWLGPGLAAWAEGDASERLHPEWKDRLAERPALDAEMMRDALPGSLPLQRPLRGEEVTGAFRDFDEPKVRRVLRMVEALVGPSAFADGVRSYTALHHGQAVRAADFWSALDSKTDRNVSAWAPRWFLQAGFPLIKVTSQCVHDRRVVSLEQSPFLLTAGTTDGAAQSWTVPVGLFNVGTGERARYALLEKVSDNFETGPCRTALKANPADVGYFRVWYEPALVSDLEAQSAALGEADRVNLVSDVFATVVTRRTPVAVFLDLVNRWRDDPSLNVGRAFRDGLAKLDDLEAGNPGRARFQQAVCGLLRPGFARLGWTPAANEPPESAVERAETIECLGRFGDRGVIDEAFRRFDALASRADAPADRLQAAVVRVAGRYANEGTFRTLEALAESATAASDRRLYLEAMAGALDPELAARFLQTQAAATDQGWRTVATRLAEVADRGEHADMVWRYLQERRDLLDNPELWQDGALASALARGLADPAATREFLADRAATSGARAQQALAERQADTEAAATVVPALDAWVDGALNDRPSAQKPTPAKRPSSG